MPSADLASIEPIGPYIEGLIRFSRDDTSKNAAQKPVFELLNRVHSERPIPGDVPKMQTHPLSDKLSGMDSETGERRLLMEVPIRLLFDKPDNNLRAGYKAFHRSTGQMLCCGNGRTAMQRTSMNEAPTEVQCRGPEHCVFATNRTVSCQLHVRLKVQVEGSEDPFALVEFQSSGLNSYRTLAAKLTMMKALFGHLRGLPLRLTSWAKSSMTSGYEPFYCANIEIKEGLSIQQARVEATNYRNSLEGLDFDAMESVVEQMEQNSAFTLNESDSIVTAWSTSNDATVDPKAQRLTPPDAICQTVNAVLQKARLQEQAEKTSERVTADGEVENEAEAPSAEPIEQSNVNATISGTADVRPTGTETSPSVANTRDDETSIFL